MAETLTPIVAHNAVAHVLELQASILRDHERTVALLQAQVQQLNEAIAKKDEAIAKKDEAMRKAQEGFASQIAGTVRRVADWCASTLEGESTRADDMASRVAKQMRDEFDAQQSAIARRPVPVE